jgi:signal transduction histidine kinase
MTQGPIDTEDPPVRFGGREVAMVISDARIAQMRQLARTVRREPFTRRAGHELLYVALGVPLAAFGLFFVGATMAVGVALTVTFVGIVIVAASVRGARGIGGWHRQLARNLLGEHVEEPLPFVARRGLFGWLQAALRDRVGWRAMAYIIVKAAWSLFSIWFAISVWWDAVACLLYPFFWRGSWEPHEFGILRNIFPPGYLSVQSSGFFHNGFILLTGVALVFLAPWAVRAVVMVDRYLVRGLLGPGAMAARVRSLEETRAQTVDASAAMLRQIERNLHDGTQAQLVALAMRLGQAKDKLAVGEPTDLDQVRALIDEAHRGAKEAIVELRDLARGIHSPALDLGLEGALLTLTSRSPVPAEFKVELHDRPTPAIESIAYFFVAELLANVAQHAQASQCSVTCVQHGTWLRLVVRDDGRGGASVTLVGTASSGLRGLRDRVRAVDGRLEITSPVGGPTVVIVDLPLHA